ncbi:hypothetical protein SPH9361_03884 [Sphingobium sp. CECT 9361]|nr:hypothetical protein SPH9361_03884 [Sphingobium sp. CECT 9361]
MDLKTSLQVSASGLRAQSLRMRIIAENLANADSVSRTAGGDPYRRRVPSFKSDLPPRSGPVGLLVDYAHHRHIRAEVERSGTRGRIWR